jgi:hypothetical protein
LAWIEGRRIMFCHYILTMFKFGSDMHANNTCFLGCHGWHQRAPHGWEAVLALHVEVAAGGAG